MNQKKSTTLYGALMSPLAVGHCALIRYQGQLMRTSQVVAIHSWNADIIKIFVKLPYLIYIVIR